MAEQPGRDTSNGRKAGSTAAPTDSSESPSEAEGSPAAPTESFAKQSGSDAKSSSDSAPRTVPGGVGVPGRAAPRRVLAPGEAPPTEELPATKSAAPDSATAPAGTAWSRSGSDGPRADAEPGERTDDPAGDGRTRAMPTLVTSEAGSPSTGEEKATADGGDASTGGGSSGAAAAGATAGAATGGHGQEPAFESFAPDESGVTIEPEPEPKVRRGTTDLGLLVLRVALGADLGAHGLQKLFSLFGGSGMGGYEQLLSDGGYRHAKILSYVGAITELGAGVLLILGLLTPLAAAGAIGVLVNTWFFREAATPGFEFFVGQGGAELEIVLLAVAVTVALAGPGRISLDVKRRWAIRPGLDALGAIVLGAGAGVAVWFLLNGANPFA